MDACLPWVVCAALLAACSAPVSELDPLPDFAIDGLGPRVGERLEPLAAALRSSPRDAAAAGKAGMLLLAYDQHALAVPFLERAQALEPAELRWKYYRGISLSKMGRHAEAAISFRHCVEINEGFLPARIRLAEAAFAANDLQAGLDRYRDLLRTAPENPLVLYGAGRAEAAAGNNEAARDRLLRAVELEPAYGEAHYALGLVFRDLGQVAESARHLEAFERSRHGEPQRNDPLLSSALALRISAAEYLKQGVEAQAAGRIGSAIALHLKALEEDPSLVQARVNLMILYGSEGRAAPAKQQYRLGVEAGPESAELHYNYGVLVYQEGNSSEASEAFRKALALNPEHALANHNMGQILEEEGRFDEAMVRYERALANRPDHGLSHYKMGMLWMRRRNASKAVQAFQEAATENSDRKPTYLFSLAAAELASGNRAGAISRFQQARRMASRYSQTELVRRIDETLSTLGAASASP